MLWGRLFPKEEAAGEVQRREEEAEIDRQGQRWQGYLPPCNEAVISYSFDSDNSEL